jgi:hypothetical protein
VQQLSPPGSKRFVGHPPGQQVVERGLRACHLAGDAPPRGAARCDAFVLVLEMVVVAPEAHEKLDRLDDSLRCHTAAICEDRAEPAIASRLAHDDRPAPGGDECGVELDDAALAPLVAAAELDGRPVGRARVELVGAPPASIGSKSGLGAKDPDRPGTQPAGSRRALLCATSSMRATMAHRLRESGSMTGHGACLLEHGRARWKTGKWLCSR